MKQRTKAQNYLSTIEFVTAFDRWAQAELPNYSRRAFAKWARIASPNFLSLVINGKRPLVGAWLEGFIQAAKLEVDEAAYMKLLSRFENSRDAKEKSEILDQIRTEFNSSEIKSLAADQLEVLTDPKAWTLYHMLDLAEQNSSWVWFKNRLRLDKWMGPQIQESLDRLMRLGLVELGDKFYSSKKKLLQSPDQIRKEANSQYHKNVLQEASVALDELDPQERAFGSLTATVPKEKLESLRAEINKFGQHLLKTYASTEKVDGEVIRINIQLYPLTRKSESENTDETL